LSLKDSRITGLMVGGRALVAETRTVELAG